MKRTLGFTAARLLGPGLLRVLFGTTSITRRGTEGLERLRRGGRPVIFVCWHGQLLPLAWVHRGEGVVVLVSEHADGEYIARVLEGLGFGTARGSSTRGGIRGLKALLRAAGAGRDLAITPDGPRGPARELKPGALAAAQLTGAAIIPCAAAASASWIAGSWDRFLVPKPFSRIVVEYAPPVEVDRETSHAERDRIAESVGRTLDALGERAAAAAEGGA